MSAVARLRDAGLKLDVRGDVLMVQPRSALTEELREFIRANKPVILAELNIVFEVRRRRILADLESHPAQRIAVDVADAPLNASPGDPVSVMIAVRHGTDILTAELHVPRDRWDPVAFLQTITETSQRAH